MAPKLLMIAWCAPGVSPKAVYEHVDSIRKQSKFKVDLFNVATLLPSNIRAIRFIKSLLTTRIKLSRYDGLIIHNTTAYFPERVRNLEKLFDIPIDSFTGIKVLMKQDEIFKTNHTKQLIKDWKFDLLLTCVPPKDINVIYPDSEFGNVRKIHTLTGYVPKEMHRIKEVPRKSRPIDISYRGMKLPFHFGKLSYMKFEIGEKFKFFCKDFGLVYDISSDSKDRIYGKAWGQFLRNSKACLAVESGASIYDFDGSIVEKTEQYLQTQPGASFEEVYENVLKSYDSIYIYNAISPRHFEAAANRTVLIMPEGEYGGIFKPDRHYISIKKDYSNIPEVMEKFKDVEFCSELTSKAFNEIILNPEYGYERLAERLDAEISHMLCNR